METTKAGWVIVDREHGVLTREYSFAPGASSRAFAARLADGGMMVVSPTTDLSEAVAAELEAFGPVKALVANNGFHHLGQSTWSERFPQARRFAPADAFKRIAKKNPGIGPFEPLSALQPLLGDNVGFREVANTKCGESWFWAKVGGPDDGGWAWYVSDVLANMEKLPKPLPLRLLFKWTKSAPGYRVFNLVLKFVVKDKKATLRQFLADIEAHPPTVVLPAHGALLADAGIDARTRDLVEKALG